jgi:bile acid:Na+ symporter, BASS family
MPTGLALSIPLIVFIFTIGIGSELTWNDFKLLMKEPKVVLVGILGQIVLLPIVAFAIAYIFRDDLVIAIGIVLLAASPGGPMSNSLVYIARARTELSITLTAISGIIALVTTPLIATLGISLFAGNDASISLPIPQTIAQIVALILVPLAIGMFLRSRWTDMVARNEKRIRQICTILMVAAMVVVVIVSWQTLISKFADFAVAGTIFVVALLVISWLYGTIFGLDDSSRFTVMVEVSIQNIVITSLIAITLLDRPEFALFSAVYAAPMALIILIILVFRLRKLSRTKIA